MPQTKTGVKNIEGRIRNRDIKIKHSFLSLETLISKKTAKLLDKWLEEEKQYTHEIGLLNTNISANVDLVNLE